MVISRHDRKELDSKSRHNFFVVTSAVKVMNSRKLGWFSKETRVVLSGKISPKFRRYAVMSARKEREAAPAMNQSAYPDNYLTASTVSKALAA